MDTNEQKDKQESPDSKEMQDSSSSPVLDDDQKQEQSPRALDEDQKEEKQSSPVVDDQEEEKQSSPVVDVEKEKQSPCVLDDDQKEEKQSSPVVDDEKEKQSPRVLDDDQKEEKQTSPVVDDQKEEQSPCVLDDDQKEEKQSYPVGGDDDQGEKQESPDSKGSQDSISSVIAEVDDYSKLPEEFDHDGGNGHNDYYPELPEGFDYGFDRGVGNDDNALLEDIFFSMIPTFGPKTSTPHQHSEAVGDTASPKFADSKKRKGIPSHSPPKSPDLKKKLEFSDDDFLGFSSTPSTPPSQQKEEGSWSECVICTDVKPTEAMRRLYQCEHFFCEDCMRNYVGRSVGENIHAVKCPEKNCNQILTVELFRHYLPEDVADQWLEAKRQAELIGETRFIVCPFPDCPAEFLDDGKGFLIRACPKCWKIFCFRCRVRWHMGLSCDQFQGSVRNPKTKEVMREILGESILGLW